MDITKTKASEKITMKLPFAKLPFAKLAIAASLSFSLIGAAAADTTLRVSHQFPGGK
ncbi:MAG: hypothetical protein ACJARK_002580, partial [Marinobacter psychrophilus]